MNHSPQLTNSKNALYDEFMIVRKTFFLWIFRLFAFQSLCAMPLAEQVLFVDDSIFGVGGTSVFVKGNGTVVYNGTARL